MHFPIANLSSFSLLFDIFLGLEKFRDANLSLKIMASPSLIHSFLDEEMKVIIRRLMSGKQLVINFCQTVSGALSQTRADLDGRRVKVMMTTMIYVAMFWLR